MKDLKTWSEFASASAHLLRRGNDEWPANKILLQAASEAKQGNPVNLAAKDWLDQGNCEWLWLRDIRSGKRARSAGRTLVLEGHNAIVDGVFYGSRTNQLYTIGSDRKIMAWGENGALLFVSADRSYQGGSGEGGRFTGAELADGLIAVISFTGRYCINILTPDGRLKSSLPGHAENILGIRSCPNGNVISWSFDNTIRIWNPVKETCEANLIAGHVPRGIYGKCGTAPLILPNGNIFSWQGDFRLWNAAGQKIAQIDDKNPSPELWEIVQEVAYVNESIYSDRGRIGAFALPNNRILTWSGRRDMQIFCGNSLEHIGCLKGSQETNNYDSSLCGKIGEPLVLSDGNVLTYGEDIRIWNPNTLELLHTLPGHDNGLIKDVIELPNGSIVSLAGAKDEDDDIRLWKWETRECLRQWSDPIRTSDRLEPLADGRFISFSRQCHSRIYPNPGEINLWDPEIEERIATFAEHTDSIYGVTVLPSGQILSWSQDKTLRMWDVSGIDSIANYEAKEPAVIGVISLPGNRILLRDNEQPVMTVLDTATGEPAYGIEGHDGPAMGALPLPDGRVLSWGGDLRIWDEDKLILNKPSPGNLGPFNCWVGPDGKILTAYFDDSVELWDSADGKSIIHLEGYKGVSEAIILPNGGIFAICWDTLRIHLPHEPEKCYAIKTEELTGFPTMFRLADGKILAWANRIFLFSGETGRCLKKFETETKRVQGACTLSNGRIAIWFSGGRMEWWNPRTGESHLGLEQKQGIIGAADWDEDLFCAWTEKELHLLNKETGDTKESLALAALFRNGPVTYDYWLSRKQQCESLQPRMNVPVHFDPFMWVDEEVNERHWRMAGGLNGLHAVFPHTAGLLHYNEGGCAGKIFWNGTGQWKMVGMSEPGAMVLYDGNHVCLAHLFHGNRRVGLSEAAELLAAQED